MQVNPHFKEFTALDAMEGTSSTDWAARSSETYTKEQIETADRWQRAQAVDAVRPEVVRVDISQLNQGHSFVLRAVLEHDTWQLAGTSAVKSFLGIVNGTAGSGKTWLIRAIKQELGDACIVLAPTGAAADNIGGATYQSKIPVPRTKVDRDAIRVCGARLKQFVADFDGKRWVIIDEMSMVGRRSLGHIDELLKQATRDDDSLFGGLNVILVGDHGQLPPVKDARVFDEAGVRHRGRHLHRASKWSLRGLEAYEQMHEEGHVFFLEKVERIDIAGLDHMGAEQCEWFRAFRLRVRDGTATHDDYTYLKGLMDAQGA
eukprot:gene27270-33584_t